MEPGASRPELIYKRLPDAVRLGPEERRILKGFAEALLEVTGSRGFTCLLTDDAQLRKLNQQFLQEDYATDVLSFPSGVEEPLGDLAISVERARAQAALFAHAPIDELRLLMLHGVLHLLGLDHERDRGEMDRAERRWRERFHLPQTVIARSRLARVPSAGVSQ